MDFSALQKLSTVVPNRLAAATTDHNGVQYQLCSAANQGRYRVLDDAGLKREAEEIEESRQLLLSMRKEAAKKKAAEPHSVRTDKASKEKKAESEALEAALLSKQYTPGADNHLLKELFEKDAELEAAAGPDPDAEAGIDYARNATHAGSWSHVRPSGVGVAHAAPGGRVEYGMDVIKERFHDNVDIIEMLYHEREALKERVEQLEGDLLDPERASWILRATKYGLPLSARHHSTSKAQAANSASSKVSPRGGSSSGATGPTAASRAKDRKNREEVFNPAEMAKRIDAPKKEVVDPNGPSRRLLADIDRYIQRRRALELDEEARKVEEAREATAAEERRQKVIAMTPKTGSWRNLDGVNQRSAQFTKDKEEKVLRLQKHYEEQEREARKASSQALRTHIQKGVVEQEMTYDAQMALENTARRERIESRKNQLIFNSKAPVDYDPCPKSYELPLPDTRFFAADPKEVIDRLDLSALRWEQHLEKIKVTQREREAEEREFYGTGGGGDPMVGMDRREKQSKERRDARIRRQEEAAAESEQRRLAATRREIASMVNAPPPESGRRLTAAAEQRAALVKDRIEAQRAHDEEHARKVRAKAAENAKMHGSMRTRVRCEEAQRRSTHGNFVELSGESAAEKREHTQREAQARARSNQKRLQESLKSRVSLYDRHIKEQEKIAAVDRALGIVKDVMDTPATHALAANKENSRYRNNGDDYDSAAESKLTYDYERGGDSKMQYSSFVSAGRK